MPSDVLSGGGEGPPRCQAGMNAMQDPSKMAAVGTFPWQLGQAWSVHLLICSGSKEATAPIRRADLISTLGVL